MKIDESTRAAFEEVFRQAREAMTPEEKEEARIRAENQKKFQEELRLKDIARRRKREEDAVKRREFLEKIHTDPEFRASVSPDVIRKAEEEEEVWQRRLDREAAYNTRNLPKEVRKQFEENDEYLEELAKSIETPKGEGKSDE